LLGDPNGPHCASRSKDQGSRASWEVAERFLTQAEVNFNDLARQPGMGAPLTLKHPDLAGMRKWRIKDFDNHLIFYQPRPNDVSIVRVLHAASDWWTLLGFHS